MRQPKHKQRSQAGDALEHAVVKAGADLAWQPEYTKSPPFVEHAAAGAVPMCPVVQMTSPRSGTVVPCGFAALYIGEGSPLPGVHTLLAQHVSRSSVESHAEPAHSSLVREVLRW